MAETNRKWTGARAVGLHLTLAVTLPAFTALGWWQLDRALSGNLLSWAYTFEWPIFAGYAVFMWWKLLLVDLPSEPTAAPPVPGSSSVRDEDDPAPTSTDPVPAGPAGPDPADSSDGAEPLRELDEYNRYLAALNASNRRKRW